jgi:hypothetical protein
LQSGSGHEKGGVEGEVGYFRRNHLVPVPGVANLDELNDLLLEACKQDEARMIGERTMNVAQAASIERQYLMPMQAEDLDLAEESFCRVDSKGCIQARTNFYSTPLRAGTQARVRMLSASVEVIYQGKLVARRQRCYQTRQHLLDLEHYLDVLSRKPGALAGSKPLAQWRAEGRWPPSYDQLWAGLKHRYGDQAGTRLMIELLHLGREHGYQRLTTAIEQALECGANDAAAVRYFLTASALEHDRAAPLDRQEVKRQEHYARSLPEVSAYDQLLTTTSGNNQQEAAR